MTYELLFHPDALDEWRKLDGGIRTQLIKKVAERLENPRVPSAQLSGTRDRYKIKLRSVGYRMVYEVRDNELVILVVTIGKRERNAAYKTAARRLSDQ